jgi:hypothetical protein
VEQEVFRQSALDGLAERCRFKLRQACVAGRAAARRPPPQLGRRRR